MEHERRVFLAGVRGPALAAGTEIVAVTTDLTRQKFRDTNLLDRCHVVDDPRTLPAMARHLISVHGQPGRLSISIRIDQGVSTPTEGLDEHTTRQHQHD